MDWKYKSAIIGGIIILLAALAFIIKQQRDTIARLQYTEQSVVEMKQLKDNIIRAQANYAATQKDVERIIKASGVDLKPIQDDLNKLGAEVKAGHQITVVTQGERQEKLPSTSTTPAVNPEPAQCSDGSKCPDPYGYMANTQHKELDEPFGKTNVPWGKASFSWRDKPWDVEIYPRKYKVVTVIGTDEKGRHYTYSKFFVDAKGKTYPVEIAESKLVEVLPTPSFKFSPRLYLGVDAGAMMNHRPIHAELVPNLQLALFSYGPTSSNPDWIFAGLGVGYEAIENNLSLLFSPIGYNVAKHLPFVDNMYVGPSASLDFAGNFSILFGIRVGL